MAIIQDGESAVTLSIDAFTKAAKVLAVDVAGNPLNKVLAGAFVSSFEVVPATLVAGTTFFSLRNTGTRRAFITRLEFNSSFSGTAAASRSVFNLTRFQGATPSGGTQTPALKRDTTLDANPHVGDIRFAPAGLTVTGVTFDAAPLHKIAVANQLTVGISGDMELAVPIVLNPGEGISIRAESAIVAGAALFGAVFWSEAD